MKKLFNEKGHLVVKYIINQIALSLFGLMISGFAVSDSSLSWLLPIGIFTLLFYYFILISFIREDGLKDGLKVEGGRMKKDIFLSLKYCSLAAIPGFLFPFINCIVHLTSSASALAINIAGICNTVTRVLLYGMYNPIDSYLFNPEYGVFKSASFLSDWGISFMCYTVFTLVVCFVSYYTGVNQMFVKKEEHE